LIAALLIEYINMICFLHPNKSLNLRLHLEWTQPCMTIFSTVQSIFRLFSHISITICEATTQQLHWYQPYCLIISMWHATSTQSYPQCEIPLRLDSVLYDHLHCIIHFQIGLSYQYSHCGATILQHWYQPYVLSISTWNASFTPVNPSIWNNTYNGHTCVWSSSTLYNPFPYWFLVLV